VHVDGTMASPKCLIFSFTRFMEAVLADSNQSGCLTVGEGVVLNGTFVVPDIASVSGSIEGDITARELIVASSGVIKGKVTAEIIDLRGEIHDTLTAKKSLFIRSTGKALGSVQYQKSRSKRAVTYRAHYKRLMATAQLLVRTDFGAVTRVHQ